MKIMEPWTCMCSFSFSLKILRYLGPLIAVLGGKEYRSTAPRHDMISQSIWLSESFIVATTYFMSKRLSNGRLICRTNSSMVNSSETTLFHPASVQEFIIDVRYVIRAGLWDFSPNSLLRRLKTVLELIAVHTI